MSSRSLNRVQLIGNLTRDVNLRYTSSGTAVASFTVATNRNYTDATGNQVESAEFTSVVAWAKLAELCAQLLKKGTKVYIEGRLQTSSWQDKETGKTMKKTEVVATEMIVLSGGGPSDMEIEEKDVPESDMEDVIADDLAVDFNELTEDDQADGDNSGVKGQEGNDKEGVEGGDGESQDSTEK